MMHTRTVTNLGLPRETFPFYDLHLYDIILQTHWHSVVKLV